MRPGLKLSQCLLRCLERCVHLRFGLHLNQCLTKCLHVHLCLSLLQVYRPAPCINDIQVVRWSESCKCLVLPFCKHVNLCDDPHLSFYLAQCVASASSFATTSASAFTSIRGFKEVWDFTSVSLLANGLTSSFALHIGNCFSKICNSASFCF